MQGQQQQLQQLQQLQQQQTQQQHTPQRQHTQQMHAQWNPQHQPMTAAYGAQTQQQQHSQQHSQQQPQPQQQQQVYPPFPPSYTSPPPPPPSVPLPFPWSCPEGIPSTRATKWLDTFLQVALQHLQAWHRKLMLGGHFDALAGLASQQQGNAASGAGAAASDPSLDPARAAQVRRARLLVRRSKFFADMVHAHMRDHSKFLPKSQPAHPAAAATAAATPASSSSTDQLMSDASAAASPKDGSAPSPSPSAAATDTAAQSATASSAAASAASASSSPPAAAASSADPPPPPPPKDLYGSLNVGCVSMSLLLSGVHLLSGQAWCNPTLAALLEFSSVTELESLFASSEGLSYLVPLPNLYRCVPAFMDAVLTGTPSYSVQTHWRTRSGRTRHFLESVNLDFDPVSGAVCRATTLFAALPQPPHPSELPNAAEAAAAAAAVAASPYLPESL